MPDPRSALPTRPLEGGGSQCSIVCSHRACLQARAVFNDQSEARRLSANFSTKKNKLFSKELVGHYDENVLIMRVNIKHTSNMSPNKWHDWNWFNWLNKCSLFGDADNHS